MKIALKLEFAVFTHMWLSVQCRFRASTFRNVISDNHFRNIIYKAQSKEFSRCFFPDNTICEKQAIKAHSIQNRGVLGELEENGHVFVLTPVQDLENSPRLEFQKVGRSKAKTFSGLCKKHDTCLFHPIDTNPLNIDDEEHLFLLSYRAVLRELHA